jgi:hypothetical protein
MELPGDLPGDAGSAGGVFPVGDDQIRPRLFPDRPDALPYRLATGAPDDVPQKKNPFHGRLLSSPAALRQCPIPRRPGSRAIVTGFFQNSALPFALTLP